MFHIRLKWKWIQPKDQLAVIKRLLSQSDTCVIATDPGREGEHIARTILEYVDYRGKLLRLWVHDLTPETIRTGFQRLRPAQEYDTLAAAAKVRAVADFWMGITATRLFSIMAKEVAKESVTLSAGRVQTPTRVWFTIGKWTSSNSNPRPSIP